MRSVTVQLGEHTHQIKMERAKNDNHWVAKCRLPMKGFMSMPLRAKLLSSDEIKTRSKNPANRDLIEDIDEDIDEDVGFLDGIASSTGVDWHGTEMSLEALEGMSRQFKAGVPYVPSHSDDEWDQVFGRTTDAVIESGAIAHDGSTGEEGSGQLLRVTVELDMEDKRSKSLMAKLDRGHVIGMSIGGWFTEMSIVTDEKDVVQRVIINGVELDHLATTRRPSNPDSWINDLSRSMEDAVKAANAPEETVTEVTEDVVTEKTEVADRDIFEAPNFVLSNDQTRKCATCISHAKGQWCERYDFDAEPTYVCESWDKASDDVLFPPAINGEESDSEKPQVVDEAKSEEPHVETKIEAVEDHREDESNLDCIKSETDNLDIAVKTGEYGEDDAKAHRSSPSVQSETLLNQEDAMSDQTSETTIAPVTTNTEVSAVLADMRSLLVELVGREKAAVPTVTPVIPEEDALRARVGELEALVGKLSEAPQRRGVSHSPTARMDLTHANALVRSVAEELGGASALVAIANEQADRRAATADNLPSRQQLEADLRSILSAALADGVITDPETRSSWR